MVLGACWVFYSVVGCYCVLRVRGFVSIELGESAVGLFYLIAKNTIVCSRCFTACNGSLLRKIRWLLGCSGWEDSKVFKIVHKMIAR